MSDVERARSLPALLLLLTVVTGIVDAVSYLQLDRVFVANMTGNIVLLGFAAAGAHQLSIPASLSAIAAFVFGSLFGGRLAWRLRDDPHRMFAACVGVELVLIGVAALLASVLAPAGPRAPYALIVLLAIAMGLQNAVARKLAVPDLTTTVLTLTITGLAADSHLAGGTSPRVLRRIAAVVAMLAGAFLGAALLLHYSASAALEAALVILAIVVAGAVRLPRAF